MSANFCDDKTTERIQFFPPAPRGTFDGMQRYSIKPRSFDTLTAPVYVYENTASCTLRGKSKFNA